MPNESAAAANVDPLAALAAELGQEMDADRQEERRPPQPPAPPSDSVRSLLGRRSFLPERTSHQAERGPMHARLDRTLDDARTLAKQIGDLSVLVTGSRPAVPPQHDRTSPGEGLFARIDQVATEIEAQLGDCRTVLEHVRKQV